MTVDETIDLLRALGFTPIGETRQETVRVPTSKASIHGRGAIGGYLQTFGGRRRFELADTNLRVTMGPSTVNLYRVDRQLVTMFVLNESTKHLTADALRAAVDAAVDAEADVAQRGRP